MESLAQRPEIETEMRIQRERMRRRAMPEWLRIKVGAVPTRRAVKVLPSTFVEQTLQRLRERDTTAALVVDVNDRLLGIVTLVDLIIDDADELERPIADVMSSPEVLQPNDMLSDALRWMLVRDFSQVPIVDAEGRALGMIGIDDALREITGPHARHIATRPADPTRGYSPRYGG